MKSFLNDGGFPALESFLSGQTLLAFDYDGTLAKLFPHPDDAVLSEEIFALLEKLAELAPVAILTGRSLADVRKFLPKNVLHLVGNHGLEGITAWESALAQALLTVNSWRPTLVSALEKHPSIILEDKAYSVTLHAAEGTSARAALTEMALQLFPATRVILGKGVLNLVPADAPHKGSALLEIMRKEGFENAFFAGDDITDEDVFALKNPRIFTVLIGNREDSDAQWQLDPQAEIAQVLRYFIAHALAARGASA